MSKNLEMSYLLDFYGEVLTEKQRDMMQQYFNMDLSLSEIADNFDITRQGVRDVIVRAEAILTDLEDKTGLIRRFHTMKQQLQQVRDDAVRMREIAIGMDHFELETLSARIMDTTDTLLKE